VDEKELNQQIEVAWRGSGSRYARALATGVHYIRTVDRFLQESIDASALVTELKK
jgi:hypothetical protein